MQNPFLERVVLAVRNAECLRDGRDLDRSRRRGEALTPYFLGRIECRVRHLDETVASACRLLRAMFPAFQGEVSLRYAAALMGFGSSNYGSALVEFEREWMSDVTNKTTVIILGDARNNYNLPHEWVLRDMQKRAKQLIWLNPESRMTWGFGDSEMDRYRPFCDTLEECRNLNQLYRVIDGMVR